MLSNTIFDVLIISCVAVLVSEAFVIVPITNTKTNDVSLFVAKEDGDSKKGYRFGDLSRGVLKKVRGGDTGSTDSKNEYRFGDLTQGVLKKVSKSSSSYKFGDISRWLDKKSKEQVSKFTSKENYKFGDMSKEVTRRLMSGEYSREDLALFLKIVATIGINLSPVTSILPLKVLTELLNLTMEASVAQAVGQKAMSAITNEIDGRMKEFVTGDRNYQAGDFAKKSLAKWTGKESYDVGDITKTFLAKKAAALESEAIGGNTSDGLELFSSESESDVLEEWDKKLLKSRQEQKGSGSTKDDASYRDWDEKFLASSSTVK
mmetsp:Transcript_9402/g.20354  ORF Transcript_9402/g.20354 Transcript_9402/m.20354 type:complete len:318 (-) Transcript_9402:3093-4046(-)